MADIDDFERAHRPEFRYCRRHLEPLLPRLWELRATTCTHDFEWAIPRVHAVESRLTGAGNMFFGTPIVVDDAIDEPIVRVVDYTNHG